MSEQKHTSGPWHVFSVYAQHEVRTPTDTLVAVVNSREDARLIAAAPDLLEALCELKQILDIVLCMQGGLPPDANGPAAKALAAIAKATRPA